MNEKHISNFYHLSESDEKLWTIQNVIMNSINNVNENLDSSFPGKEENFGWSFVSVHWRASNEFSLQRNFKARKVTRKLLMWNVLMTLNFNLIWWRVRSWFVGVSINQSGIQQHGIWRRNIMRTFFFQRETMAIVCSLWLRKNFSLFALDCGECGELTWIIKSSSTVSNL